MAELEYHHFTTLNALIIPSNNDQWSLSWQRYIISYCVPSDDCPHHQSSIPGKKKIKATSDQASKTTNSQVQEAEEHVKQTKFLAFSMCWVVKN